MDSISLAELRALFLVVLASLSAIIAAIVLLVRSGRTVSFPMIERRSGPRRPTRRPEGARPVLPPAALGLPPPRGAATR